jgi:CSLREA domain-containing protein
MSFKGATLMSSPVRIPLVSLLLIALCLPAALQAAVYIPTKTADTGDGACGSDCSLREAITAANGHPGENVILLHAGTYTLTAPPSGASASLEIQGTLSLIGDDAGTTIIDGNHLAGIFHVAAGATVEIRDVTLRNGLAAGGGGAIRNDGALTLLRTLLTFNDSTRDGAGASFGGAIASSGSGSSLTLADSAVINNDSLGSGGGLALGGTARLANVTIARNQASDLGGGLYLFSDARATLNNVTVTGNTAQQGGGLAAESAVSPGVPATITNSILAGNSALVRSDDCRGSIATGYDLVGAGEGCLGPAAANHDQVGTAVSPIDPKLGPPDQNGGSTPTAALLAGSPAIDAGNPAPPGSGNGACEATDQRNATRPADAVLRSVCDQGAFEATTHCVAGGRTLCLSGGRFKVTAHWQTPAFGSGEGTAVRLTGDSGFFWFFDPANIELTVKVLDGCDNNHRYWFFASGLTDVGVDLTVTDTATNQARTYHNPLGKTFVSILNSNAFATCP